MIMAIDMSRYDNLIGVHNQVNDELASKGYYIDYRVSPSRYVLTKINEINRENDKDIYVSKRLKDIDIYINKNYKDLLNADKK